MRTAREIYMLDRGLLIVGLIITTVFFFIPWFSVTIEGLQIEVRGFQIGFIVGQLMDGSARYHLIFRLIQLLPLFLAGLSGLFLWHNSYNRRGLLRLITAVSIVAIIYLINLKSRAAALPEVTSVKWGMFGIFLGIVCILCGSLYSLRDGAIQER